MNFRKLKNIDEICVGDTMDYCFDTSMTLKSKQIRQWKENLYIEFKVLKIEKDEEELKLFFDFNKSKKNKNCDWERGFIFIGKVRNNIDLFRIKKQNFKHINYNFLND